MKDIPFFKILGIIFALVGLYFIIKSTSAFIETYNQRDWQAATATVIDVQQRIERKGIKTKTRKTVYDLVYEYTVDEKVYTGTVYATADYSKNVGSTFEIKYNPESPDEHTDVLSTDISNLIAGIIGSFVFIFFALIMTGVINIKRIKNIYKRRTE